MRNSGFTALGHSNSKSGKVANKTGGTKGLGFSFCSLTASVGGLDAEQAVRKEKQRQFLTRKENY